LTHQLTSIFSLPELGSDKKLIIPVHKNGCRLCAPLQHLRLFAKIFFGIKAKELYGFRFGEARQFKFFRDFNFCKL
jgi:hypothetical protein